MSGRKIYIGAGCLLVITIGIIVFLYGKEAQKVEVKGRVRIIGDLDKHLEGAPRDYILDVKKYLDENGLFFPDDVIERRVIVEEKCVRIEDSVVKGEERGFRICKPQRKFPFLKIKPDIHFDMGIILSPIEFEMRVYDLSKLEKSDEVPIWFRITYAEGPYEAITMERSITECVGFGLMPAGRYEVVWRSFEKRREEGQDSYDARGLIAEQVKMELDNVRRVEFFTSLIYKGVLRVEGGFKAGIGYKLSYNIALDCLKLRYENGEPLPKDERIYRFLSGEVGFSFAESWEKFREVEIKKLKEEGNLYEYYEKKSGAAIRKAYELEEKRNYKEAYEEYKKAIEAKEKQLEIVIRTSPHSGGIGAIAYDLSHYYYNTCQFNKSIEIWDKYREEISSFLSVERSAGHPEIRPLLYYSEQLKELLKNYKGLYPPPSVPTELLSKPESEWPDWLRVRVEKCRKMGAIDW